MLTLPTWRGQSIGRQVNSLLWKETKRLNNQEMKIFCAAKSEMMGMTTVFNASGVDKENFVKYTEENPATYRVAFVLFNFFVEGDYYMHLFCLA